MSSKKKTSMPETLRTMIYGQTRTSIDILKVLNEENPIPDSKEATRRLFRFMMKRHREFDGVFANFACRLLENWEDTKKDGSNINFDELEAALMDKNGASFFDLTHADEVYHRYCVAKLLHYIQFLNEFRKYSSWGDIREDLETTLFRSSCGGEVAHIGFFLFSDRVLIETDNMFRAHWEEISDDGRLSNDKMEKVFFENFRGMVESIGLEKTIEQAYTYQGCHPNWLVPQKVVGPLFLRNPDGTYDVRCGSSPLPDSIFELRVAEPLLLKSEAFIHVQEYFVPIRDHYLPVYHSYMGKLHFQSQEEKNELINRLQVEYFNNGQ